MNYQTILNDIKKWAESLIIYQYSQSPKNKAFINIITELIFAGCLPLQIRDLCLNIEKSEGAQLDVVGKWVGVDRYYGGEIWEHPYLSFPLYSTIKDGSYNQYQGGFSKYTTFEDNDGGFLTYAALQDTRATVNKLGDDLFRKLIQLKVIKNSINHTCKNIDDAIWDWSDGHVYTTWGVMKVNYHYDSEYSKLMTIAQSKGILLCPTGCEIEITEES